MIFVIHEIFIAIFPILLWTFCVKIVFLSIGGVKKHRCVWWGFSTVTSTLACGCISLRRHTPAPSKTFVLRFLLESLRREGGSSSTHVSCRPEREHTSDEKHGGRERGGRRNFDT